MFNRVKTKNKSNGNLVLLIFTFLLFSSLGLAGEHIYWDMDGEPDDFASLILLLAGRAPDSKVMISVNGKDAESKKKAVREIIDQLGINSDQVSVVRGSRIVVSTAARKAIRSQEGKEFTRLGAHATDGGHTLTLSSPHKVLGVDPDSDPNGHPIRIEEMRPTDMSKAIGFIKEGGPTKFLLTGPTTSISKGLEKLGNEVGTESLSKYVSEVTMMGGGNPKVAGKSVFNNSTPGHKIEMLATFNESLDLENADKLKKLSQSGKFPLKLVSTDRSGGYGTINGQTYKNFYHCFKAISEGKALTIPGCEVPAFATKSPIFHKIDEMIREWSNHAHTSFGKTLERINLLRAQLKKLESSPEKNADEIQKIQAKLNAIAPLEGKQKQPWQA